MIPSVAQDGVFKLQIEKPSDGGDDRDGDACFTNANARP
jgi:hypothetical protein